MGFKLICRASEKELHVMMRNKEINKISIFLCDWINSKRNWLNNIMTFLYNKFIF